MAEKAISEEITMAGTTSKAGNLAFDKITSVEPDPEPRHRQSKPVRFRSQPRQPAGTATLTFVSAATGASFTISCELAAEDITDTTAAAARIVEVLNADT